MSLRCEHKFVKVVKKWQTERTRSVIGEFFNPGEETLNHSEERMVCEKCGTVVKPFTKEQK